MNQENPTPQQRLDGAWQIAEYAIALAAKTGITLDKPPIWDKGDAIHERVNHILQLSANGKTQDGTFPDEWLKDYPGVVGTETTRAIVRAMVRQLSQ